RSHREILRTRTKIPALPQRAEMGRRQSRAFLALSNYRRSGAVISGELSNGESVVATFFLIRYQSVVASRREINFARQLFRISFFISALEQQFADTFAESFRGKAALDPAAMTD